MTEFWVSNAKHWCKFCKVWMQGDKESVKKHEQGKRHLETMIEFKKEKREAKQGSARDAADIQRQLRDIEKAAAAAVSQDLASGAVRYSQAASTYGLKGAPPPGSLGFLSQSAARQPPPPPPRPGGGHRANNWLCRACERDNFGSRSDCLKCGAPKPPPSEEEEDDDGGVYSAGGVTYLEGKRHVEKFKRNTPAQVWVEELEDWVDCVIASVQRTAVAHTQGLETVKIDAVYFPPSTGDDGDQPAANGAAGGGGQGAAAFSIETFVEDAAAPPSSAAAPRVAGALAEGCAVAEAGPSLYGGGPSYRVAKGLAADKFRLIALDETGKWEDPDGDKAAAAQGSQAQRAQRAQREAVTPPPVDEATGFGGWQTLSCVEVDDAEAAAAEEERKERQRLNSAKAVARKAASLAEAERLREAERRHVDGDDDSALANYDPHGTGVYRGVVLEPPPPPPSSSSSSAEGEGAPPPPPPVLVGSKATASREKHLAYRSLGASSRVGSEGGVWAVPTGGAWAKKANAPPPPPPRAKATAANLAHMALSSLRKGGGGGGGPSSGGWTVVADEEGDSEDVGHGAPPPPVSSLHAAAAASSSAAPPPGSGGLALASLAVGEPTSAAPAFKKKKRADGDGAAGGAAGFKNKTKKQFRKKKTEDDAEDA